MRGLKPRRQNAMEPAEIQERIQRGLPGTEVHVRGDGSHFEAVVAGEVFVGQSAINRQRVWSTAR
jgi:acid stress-induced BolA-like protein IbaG/YrbA